MANSNMPAQVTESAADRGSPAPAADPSVVADLVTANHILFDLGIVDAFGHVSVRHDKDPERYLLSRNMAPGQVEAEDVIEFHLDGTPVDAAGRRVYLERFIHGQIYRARPDVTAIVHSHSHNIVPLSVVKGKPLRAMFHMAGFIGEEVPLFEIRDVAGKATDLLISNNDLGEALAKTLDNRALVLMRGHGSTVVASSLPEACYRAFYAEMNALYQVTAMQLGEVTYLTAEEGASAARNIEPQMMRPWDLWKAAAEARRAKRI